jgi:DNA end-binding protein Ku
LVATIGSQKGRKMRAIWTGDINFGLINIPIKLYSATESHNLDLNLLRQGDLCPIRYARVCREDGKEVPWDDVVKGYEYQEGDFVTLDNDDFQKANAANTHIIEIGKFVKATEIESIYYDTPYFLEPKKEGHKTYCLLREGLKATKTVGLGQFAMRNREHLVVVRPHGDMLLLIKLRYQDEIRNIKPLNLSEELVNNKELNMAKQLIEQLTDAFNPKDYKDTYINDLKKIIEAKAKGKKLKTAKLPKQTNVTDIMSLLKKSLVAGAK